MVLENTTSDKIPVTSGVPQVPVLEPILFLIYINDIPEYLKHSNIRLFADDSIIYRKFQSQKDCLDLQDDLEAAAKWEEEDWLMAFHPDKCNLLSITTKRKPEHFYYNLHGHILESVDSAKYLGITLQSNLKWTKHIDQTASKANKTLSFVRRNLKVDSSSIKKKTCISSSSSSQTGVLLFSVWDTYTAENNYKLGKVQRRDVRYVCHRYHNTSSVTEMMDDLILPTLKERRTKTRQINFYKISNNKMEIPYRHTYAKSIKNQNFTLKNI